VTGGGLVLCPRAGPLNLSEKLMPPSTSPPPPPPPISLVQIFALSHAAFLLLPAYFFKLYDHFSFSFASGMFLKKKGELGENISRTNAGL
jgi:hypothetical protein